MNESKPVYCAWEPGNSVFNEKLDQQHRKLLGIINDVYFAANSKADFSNRRVEISKFLNKLEIYTNEHFDFEERLMGLIEYHDAEKHIKIHKQIRTKTEEFIKAFEANPSYGLAMDIIEFLKKWWETHVTVTDSKYVPTLKKKQIK